MPRKSMVVAVCALALAVAFCAVFMLAKQVPWLASANPTANDPYDAVGSFAVQAAVALGLVGVWRAWLLRDEEPRSVEGAVARSGIAVCAVVAMTLVSDFVALVRFPGAWLGTTGGTVHAAALAVLGLCTLALGVAAARTDAAHLPRKRQLIAAIVVVLLAVAVLALYPDAWRSSVQGALLTVVVGAVCLFVPVRLIVVALATPIPEDEPSVWGPLDRLPHGVLWALVVLVGLAVGAAAVLAELSAGGGQPPARRLLLVVGAYVGLETFAALLGYALLRTPVGLPGARLLSSSPARS